MLRNASLDEILDLTLATPTGEQVALRNLVSTAGRPRADPHRPQGPAAAGDGQANVAGRDLGSVAADVQAGLDRIPRPVGYDLSVAGKFEEQQKAFRELVVSLLLALVLVYMVLACQYESLRDPLVVMFSVPVAAVGVLVMLFLTGHHPQSAVATSAASCSAASWSTTPFCWSIRPASCVAAACRSRDAVAEAGPAPAAADPDDHPDHHSRPAAAGPRHRRGGRRPGAAGPGGGRRADRLDPDHPGADSGGLFTVPPGSEEGPPVKAILWTRPLRLVIVMSGIGIFYGCAPDRWPVFDHYPQPALSAEKNSFIDVPDPIIFQTEQDKQIPVPEKGPLVLSLEEASILALRSNQDLQVREIQPVIAGAFEKIERGVFDPEIFFEAVKFQEEALETSRSTRSQFSVDANEAFAIAGVRQKLPTGTDVEVSVEQNRDISNREPEQQVARVGLSLTQALLRGFGPAVNLVRVRQAELDTLSSNNELRGFTEALLAETETAYWKYILAQQEIAIFEESLAVSRKQRDEIAFRIEVGALPEIEIAAARAEIARREQALIEARAVLEERRLRLLRLLNPGPHSQLERPVVATSEPFIDPQPLTDLSERIILAGQARPDLKEALLLLEKNSLETIVTRNGLLPRLDFFIALGQTGYADTFSESFRELNGNTYDFSVGVRLSHFLGNREAQGRDLIARASRQQAGEAVANLRQLIELDVRLTANEVERTRQQIAASGITRMFEEETFQAEKERFDVGSSTALLVSQAQRDLLVSRIAEVRAVVNYRTALVNLYLAEGSLLERRGIQLDVEKDQRRNY